jgi:hypothetical protein
MDTLLSRVFWIGGSPCSGKSTVTEALAAATGYPVYRCDDAYYRHQHLVTAEAQPVYHRLRHLSVDALWMRPVDAQIAEELTLYREEFPFILADLAELTAAGPVLAEGAAQLPELLAGIGIDPHRAIWMVPTEPFQREQYARRDWRHEVLADCIDPEAAWQHWMARDAGFARAVAADAARLGYRVLTTDGSVPIPETIATVSAWLGLSPTRR